MTFSATNLKVVSSMEPRKCILSDYIENESTEGNKMLTR